MKQSLHRVFILFLFFALFGFAPAFASDEIIANVNVYDSQSRSYHRLYSIDVEDGTRKLLGFRPDDDIIQPRLSANSRFILASSFNSRTFTKELILIDRKTSKIHELTYTPKGRVSAEGKPVGTFDNYGFSPDNRWIVIHFPDGITISKGSSTPPLMCSQMKPNDSSLIFIDTLEWLESKDFNSIIKIQGDGFPSFSNSSRRFIVPVESSDAHGRKAMLYEIEDSPKQRKPSFFGFLLPFSTVSQVSFASDNLIYLVSGTELILYDLIGSRVSRLNDCANFQISSLGYFPSHLPCPTDFSEGAISLGGKYFAFLMPSKLKSIRSISLQGGGDEFIILPDISNKAYFLVYSDYASSMFKRIDIPPLPEKAYGEYLLYHRLYIPRENNSRFAILSSTGWEFQVFRVVDLERKWVSDAIEGIFMSMSSDGQSVVYLKCSDNNDCFKGNANFSIDSVTCKGKKTYVFVNQLRHLNFKTGADNLLILEPSHTSDAFFSR